MADNEKCEADLYDEKQGQTSLADEQKLANLSTGANQPPPQATAFKVSGK